MTQPLEVTPWAAKRARAPSNWATSRFRRASSSASCSSSSPCFAVSRNACSAASSLPTAGAAAGAPSSGSLPTAERRPLPPGSMAGDRAPAPLEEEAEVEEEASCGSRDGPPGGGPCCSSCCTCTQSSSKRARAPPGAQQTSSIRARRASSWASAWGDLRAAPEPKARRSSAMITCSSWRCRRCCRCRHSSSLERLWACRWSFKLPKPLRSSSSAPLHSSTPRCCAWSRASSAGRPTSGSG
mmetsp:Transcript_98784/g.178351  ORF Transcript_98784/g.178351 Transcript_98784/m.178351 type:complete len:241 (+) Transcript_98784:13-735(+)